MRCDSPTDVIIIGRDCPYYGETRNVPWRHVPYGMLPGLHDFNGSTAESWKIRGDELFRNKSYGEAREACEVALQMAAVQNTIQEDGQLLQNINLNLAQTYLDLGMFEHTLLVSFGCLLLCHLRNNAQGASRVVILIA